MAPHRPVARGPVARGTLAALIALVALADLLFLGHRLGLSVAVFGVALVLAVRVLIGPARPAASDGVDGAILGLGLLPVVEDAHALSLVFAATAVLAVVVRIARGPQAGRILPLREMAGFAARYLSSVVIEAPAGFAALVPGRPVPRPMELLRTWLLPAVAGLLLAGLLLAANPVLSLWASELDRIQPGLGPLLRHAGFWPAAALLIRPVLMATTGRGSRDAATSRGRAYPGWMNDASIRNALVVFNLLLGLQTGLDLTYLWGGATLPDGITPAEYAQRGAYPLVATALLAGIFAIVSQPFAKVRPALRALLGLWLAQNVMLVASAALRLDLYIDVHGLTRLRVAAAIWMALTAAGLGLTAWQAARGLPNGWLLSRVAVLGVGTLWLCCFLSLGGIVARGNVDRYERTGLIDRDYLCSLGLAAAPAVVDHLNATREALCPLAMVQPPGPSSWQEWGFRDWRVRRYVAAARRGGGTG